MLTRNAWVNMKFHWESWANGGPGELLGTVGAELNEDRIAEIADR